jgi:exodeoxyribonuclease VII small subunit
MSRTTPQADYQTLNQQLDEVLAKLQQPDVQVDAAVALYEQGLQLIAELEKHLKQAENKIEQLKLKATP